MPGPPPRERRGADRRGARIHPRHGRHDRARRPRERRACRAAGRDRAAGAAAPARRAVPDLHQRYRQAAGRLCRRAARGRFRRRRRGDDDAVHVGRGLADRAGNRPRARARQQGHRGTARRGRDRGDRTIPTSEGVEAVYTGWHRELAFTDLEAAVHDIWAGARAVTASHVPFFATSDGKGIGTSYAINSMIRALTGKRPRVLGKPSRDGLLRRFVRHGPAEDRGAGNRRGRRRSRTGNADGEPGRGGVGRESRPGSIRSGRCGRCRRATGRCWRSARSRQCSSWSVRVPAPAPTRPQRLLFPSGRTSTSGFPFH